MYKENELITRYLNRLETIKKRSNNTITSYRTDLTGFEKFILKKNLTLIEVKQSDIEDFQIDMTNRGWSDNTINRKLSSIREFYKHLQIREGLKDNPAIEIELLQIKRRTPKYLNKKQTLKLMSKVEEQIEPYRSRDRLMLLIFLTTGIRLSGLANIKLTDIVGNTLTVIEKGDVQREVGLDDLVIQALRNYKKVRKNVSEYLFVSNRGKPMSISSIQYTINKYLELAKLDKGYSTHSLRHTAATLMLEAGNDIRVIQEVLGHASISTTMIYTHVSNSQVRKASSSVAQMFK